MSILGRLILVGLAVAPAIPARAAVLCQTASATLKVRDAYRPRETQVDPAALGLQGPSGAQGPGLTAKDTNGKVVGSPWRRARSRCR